MILLFNGCMCAISMNNNSHLHVVLSGVAIITLRKKEALKEKNPAYMKERERESLLFTVMEHGNMLDSADVKHCDHIKVH